jgi:hypothetical protein
MSRSTKIRSADENLEIKESKLTIRLSQHGLNEASTETLVRLANFLEIDTTVHLSEQPGEYRRRMMLNIQRKEKCLEKGRVYK